MKQKSNFRRLLFILKLKFYKIDFYPFIIAVLIKLSLSFSFTFSNSLKNMIQTLNQTKNSVRSYLSDSQTSKNSFRVIVKNRITHQTFDPEIQKNKSGNHLLKSTVEDETFQNVKDNLKKYIKNMKTPAKIVSRSSKMNTIRSSCHLSQKDSKLNSSRSTIRSSKNLGPGLKSSLSLKQKGNLNSTKMIQKSDNEDVSLINIKQSVRYHTLGHQEEQTKLPLLRNSSQPNEEFVPNDGNLEIELYQTTDRQRIRELENKIEVLLVERLRMLSSSNSFSSHNDSKNKTSYKLLEKEIDRILEQIRKIKQTQELDFQTIEADSAQRDGGINKNIEMLEKKVKIIERLIAQKLFQSDNLKNQYLQKIKQNRSAIYDRRSKSSTIYNDFNINPSKFKPQPYLKSPIYQNDRTTFRAAYKIPLKSYYVTPQKDNFYNPSKLGQPLPRSTYDCQYMTYGAIPKQLIAKGSGQPDHKIFSNTLSEENQKTILKSSTYKNEFVQKFDKEPINFKQLDCYKDKFKNLQVNYGNDKHDAKIVNSRSVIEYFEEDKKNFSKNRLQSLSKQLRLNSQKTIDQLTNSNGKMTETKSRVQDLKRQIDQMKQSESKVSMIQQQELRKHNLFNQRLKSQIKHKNVYNQKYKFKTELIKERIKKMERPLQKNSLNNITIEY